MPRGYICKYCGDVIERRDNLRRHIRSKHSSHNPLPTFDCTYCGKGFVRKYSWSRHEWTCPKRKNVSSLTISPTPSKMSHRVARQWKCCVCGGKFSRASNYDDHILICVAEEDRSVPTHISTPQNGIEHAHTSGTGRSCSKCGEEFLTHLGLNTHEQICVDDKDNENVNESLYRRDRGGQCITPIEVSSSNLSKDNIAGGSRACSNCGEEFLTYHSLNLHEQMCKMNKESMTINRSSIQRGGGTIRGHPSQKEPLPPFVSNSEEKMDTTPPLNSETNKNKADRGTRTRVFKLIPGINDDRIIAPFTGDESLDRVMGRHWLAITTKCRQLNLLNELNIRLWDPDEDNFNPEILENIVKMWERTKYSLKANCSFGVILEHKTSEELRYYHSSANNATVFEELTTISSRQQLNEFYEKFARVDAREVGSRNRPNTSWRVRYVTNVTFYFVNMFQTGRIGGIEKAKPLPRYVVRNKHILCLRSNSSTGESYKDNCCMFRCLAVMEQCKCPKQKCSCQGKGIEQKTREMYETYRMFTKSSVVFEHFEGIEFGDLITIEKCFGVGIYVFSLLPANRGGTVVWSSNIKSERKLHVNIHSSHFSYIKNIDSYAKHFVCSGCSAGFTRAYSLKVHKCSPEKGNKFSFPGGEFKPSDTIFTLLKERAGIVVTDPKLLFYPYRITYDIEAFLPRDNLPSDTNTIHYTASHELLSISVCSNVPKFLKPKCFVRKSTAKALVDEFVTYLIKIAEEAGDRVRVNFCDVISQLFERITEREKEELPWRDAGFSSEFTYNNTYGFSGLMDLLNHYIENVPVLGFNSQRYDINVMKSELLQKVLIEEGEFKFVVKRMNNMTCIESPRLRFLDIRNYLAPGLSYEKYLKAFHCEESKGFFPYEWMDSLDKLQNNSLPEMSDFHNEFTGQDISYEDYSFCVRTWKRLKMKTFSDFLVWYNNLDVLPFIEALAKQSSVYEAKGIDMLKSAISLPGAATRWLFVDSTTPSFHTNLNPRCDASITSSVQNSRPVCLLDERTSDIYPSLKASLVGGPSIIFHRYHEKDKTFIREEEYGDTARVCKQVLGVDANALYLWCMMQEMPTGYPKVRRKESNFTPDPLNISRVAQGWLQCESVRRRERILVKHDGGEKLIGRHRLPVDGFGVNSQIVFQFHGCFWHAHCCNGEDPEGVHPTRQEKRKVIREDTKKKEDYIKSLGYTLVSIWECEWRVQVSKDPAISKFLKPFYKSMYGDRCALTQDEIILRIKSGEMFGFIECDIRVPPSLEGKFSEMAPIFKNTEVGIADASDHMRDFAKGTNFLKTPQRLLIGSMFGEKILLLSTLVKWYLEQGLELTNIYRTIEYTPRRAYERFGETVTEARRRGDVDPSMSLLADTHKLVGNSVYGRTITNKERHVKVSYVQGDYATSQKIRSKNFISLDEMDDEFYEVVSRKKKIVMDIPYGIGFSILNLAKLKMLQFYYDCMDRYIDRRDFQYVEMDTDSAYMALSGTMESVIKPSMRREFFERYHEWFPQPYCNTHYDDFISTKLSHDTLWKPDCSDCKETVLKDKRTPGLFKEEFVGDGIVALNSKTYCCWDNKDSVKYSSKGLSKKTNKLSKEDFLKVLNSKTPISGTNRGFVIKDHSTYTYSQLRTSISYFYAKRKVHADGVTTSNIDR